MSRLNKIQSKIQELEGGIFQKLCDSYLYKKFNWDNIASPGSMMGTNKTLKGIPDSFHVNKESDKYILVMYGTRKDVVKKLKKDISDAIIKSNVDIKDIEKIICCHNSTQYTTEKDQEIRKHLRNELNFRGELLVIGLENISQDLQNIKYQKIVKEFLGIDELSDQVCDIEEFLKRHDKSNTNAPLSTNYVGTFKEMDELIRKLQQNQILLVHGPAGVGKTKCVVEMLNRVDKENNVVCVKSNGLPEYQDVKDALDDRKINYIFLDDANLFINLNAILGLLTIEPYGQNLKIIITVRDYAHSKIIRNIQRYNTIEYEIPPMNDEGIKKLVTQISDFPIIRVNQITDISKQNPRIAVVSAKYAKNHPKESKIINMQDYYSQIIIDNGLSMDEKKSLFALSFLNKVDLTNSAKLEYLLKFLNIDFSKFKNSIEALYNKELCDMYENSAAKISDQSLSDFIMIEFVAKNKKYKIRDFFKTLYLKYSLQIVEMLNRITAFETTNEWISYVKSEIGYIYANMIIEEMREEFLSRFAVVIPNEAFDYIYNQIDKTEKKSFDILQNNFKSRVDKSSIQNSTIKIICTLSNVENFKMAFHLLWAFFEKRQDKAFEVFNAIKEDFNLDLERAKFLDKREVVLNHLLDLDVRKITHIEALVVCNIVINFFDFSGDIIKGNESGVEVTKYNLIDGEYLINFHKRLIDALHKIYKLDFHDINALIDKFIFEYPVYEWENGFQKTVISDLKYIKATFLNNFHNSFLDEELIDDRLYYESERYGFNYQIFSNYKVSNSMNIYRQFTRKVEEDAGDTWEDKQKQKASDIIDTLRSMKCNFTDLFNMLCQFQLSYLTNNTELIDVLLLIYKYSNYEKKVELIKELINSDFKISPCYYEYFMKEISFDDGRKILDGSSRKIDNGWEICNLLVCDNPNQNQVRMTKKLIKACDDFEYLNVLSFSEYIEKDKSILSIFIEKYDSGNLSGSFFIPKNFISDDKVQKIVEIIGKDNFYNIYLDSLQEKNYDKRGRFLKNLVKDADSNFICNVLKRLNMLYQKSIFEFNFFDWNTIWQSNQSVDGIKKYLDFLISQNKLIYIVPNGCLEELAKSMPTNFFEIIKDKILMTKDDQIIVELYNLSVEIFKGDLRIKLFELFKSENLALEILSKMHLISVNRSWSGSIVPVIDEEIDYLKQVSNIFDGLRFIPYKNVINSEIKRLEEKSRNLLTEYVE